MNPVEKPTGAPAPPNLEAIRKKLPEEVLEEEALLADELEYNLACHYMETDPRPRRWEIHNNKAVKKVNSLVRFVSHARGPHFCKREEYIDGSGKCWYFTRPAVEALRNNQICGGYSMMTIKESYDLSKTDLEKFTVIVNQIAPRETD